MSGKTIFIWLFSCLCFPLFTIAQTIRGEVVDREDRLPITGVTIKNVYTSLAVTTGEKGGFVIAASNDQLLEFNKPGYKTTRVRIPRGQIPSYFEIVIQKGIQDINGLQENNGNRYDYRSDSIRFHDLYKHELDFPKLTGLDMIQHPFSALSNKNREIWRFQDEYTDFEKEKYIDRTFNEATVTAFTGLSGDSLHTYMRLYRPTYEQLRGMNDYNFYNYIKTSADIFKEKPRGRGAQ